MKQICVKITGCKTLTIIDNYDWEDIDPSISVTNTLITLKYISSTTTGDIITITDEDEYINTIDVLPATILSSWTKIEDGYFQIKSKYTIGQNNKGSISFSLDIQPTLNTFTNFLTRTNLGSNITNQWYYDSGMIGANTTETASNMVDYANDIFTTPGYECNLIASSIGNIITITTTENTTFYNNHNAFYILNKQEVDGSYAIGLFTLITGDSITYPNDDIYMFISGGSIANIINTYSEVFNKCT